MAEDIYPRPISLSNYLPFQASHVYTLGTIVRPIVNNNHIYIVTIAGTSSSEPSWPLTSQGTVISGGVTFTEHGTSPGVQYLKFLKKEKDYNENTITSKYEDGGRDFNTSSDDVPQYYELEYDGLTDDEVDVLDDFYDAHKISQPFTLIEPRNEPWSYIEGATVSGCYFAPDGYKKDHRKVKFTQSRKVILVKYPS